MKAGDLVRFRKQPDPSTGLIVQVRLVDFARHGTYVIGVSWSFMPGTIGWQKSSQLEVISEGR